MSRMNIDMLHGDALPKRGDLMESNSGNRKMRTWLVLAVHPLKPIRGVPRARLWMERWWEIDPGLRNRLARSAERNGGQRLICFVRYPAKKKAKSFEDLMRTQRTLD